MTGKPLVVSENQVAKLLEASDCINLARNAYIRLAKHQALNPERLLLTVPGGASFFTMPAYILGQKTVAVKVAGLNPANSKRHRPSVSATIYVYNSTNGSEVARIEAETLTAIRTAASSAVATDLLAPSDSQTLGVIGTGRQANAHVPALLKVRGFSRMLVYSRSKAHRKKFTESIRKICKVPATHVDSIQKVVSSSQVLVLATNSQTPLFNGRHVQPGTQVNAIGSALPEAREVDSHLVAKGFLVVDSIPQALSTYGDIMIPIREMRITRERLNELGELLIHPGRIPKSKGTISLFKSGGLAVLDAAFADHIVTLLTPTSRKPNSPHRATTSPGGKKSPRISPVLKNVTWLPGPSGSGRFSKGLHQSETG
jgi:ornithine cyclodeaminase/alanine dehydrogenase-like protein (mu-crystallin family)